MRGKWRPSLWFVLGGALAGTLGLSLAGLVALRYLGPEIGFRPAAILLAAGIGLATLVLGALLVRLLARPVFELSRRAEAVRRGQSEGADPLNHYGTQELHRLGQNVLEMAQTLQRREASIRTFADHVTHELKTPVSAVHAAAELLEDSPDLSSEDRQLVAQIQGANQQMQDQLNALHRIAAAREPAHHGTCQLQGIEPLLRTAHPEVDVHLTGEDISLPLAPQGLQIVLTHLLDNAAQHGATRVSVDASQIESGLALTITDNGPGISSGNRPHVFEPFFTSRRDTGGTGMGLPTVRNLLQAHGADIAVIPTDAGAAFKVSFPDIHPAAKQ
ncbi:Sensor histidine kinase CssS [Falsiruegeria litorea R37]|uniref:histidine kinase n=1 Tax=Falsiruegeria litorea R37 TaxID=1200284 RepID=A0A1Y5RW39_9RHOB|nr:HAMP domain-containing sensor histidine kinase [Falsiruegeria litorea]SLN26643.1 Sensor histidine kinase CssS [Falsiruegeria litorea R37]